MTVFYFYLWVFAAVGIVPIKTHIFATPENEPFLSFSDTVKTPTESGCTDSLSPHLELSTYTRNITTVSNDTQAYVNQALALAAAFNHDEALRSIQKALLYDSECAMCRWIMAYNLSPNINRPLTQEKLKVAQNTMDKLTQFKGTAVETLLIYAMKKRFASNRTTENGYLFDQEYAAEMGKIANRFQKDADVLAWYGQALMETSPWKYYDRMGKLLPAMRRAKWAFDSALTLAPSHPLALHLNIHLVEPSNHPCDGLDVASKLNLTTLRRIGMGHLVHMPGHIYLRCGQYDRSSKANADGIRLDKEYFEKCKISERSYNGYYHELYYCHKHAFLIFSASMEGRRALSTATAQSLISKCHINVVAKELQGVFQTYVSWPWQTFLRFGNWKAILKILPPASTTSLSKLENGLHSPSKQKRVLSREQTQFPNYGTVMLHFAQGFAYASLASETSENHTQICMQAANSYQQFHGGAQDPRIRGKHVFMVTMGTLLDIAKYTLLGRFAANCPEFSTFAYINKSLSREPQWYWEKAVFTQDRLPYMEPPYWPMNVRSCLGAFLLQQEPPKVRTNTFEYAEVDISSCFSQAQEAEKVFLEDLKVSESLFSSSLRYSKI
uniref:Uncharacterized protein n=1 Tax=Aplanochytrium stocchinoi TaxID=215587 RepID=A0A7S3PJ05_9STRA